MRRLIAPSHALCLSFTLSLFACGPSRTGGNFGEDGPDMTIVKVDPNADVDGDGFKAKDDCNDHDKTVYPGAPERCDPMRKHTDFNCNGVYDDICDDDGDGFVICPGGDTRCGALKNDKLPGGDCNDDDPTINPGAYEVVGNMRDDDCNGKTDMDDPKPVCDNQDPIGMEASVYAQSMDLCAPWLLDASFNRLADATAKRITNHFGLHWTPQAGKYMALFSTGVAADEKDPGYQDPQPGTPLQGREDNPLPINSHNVCTGGVLGAPAIANDMVAITLTIQVPTNAKGFSFKFNFFSAEYPEFVGNQYNDMFVASLESKKFTGNISFDSNSDPITVNNAFFAVCDSSPICSNVMNPKTEGHTCTKEEKTFGYLLGTGYERFANNGERFGGATGWLTTTAPVTPGEIIKLTLFVFDSGDHYYDSAVLLDGFEWLFDEAVLGTNPVG